MLKHENIELSWIFFYCYIVDYNFFKKESVTTHLMRFTNFNFGK